MCQILGSMAIILFSSGCMLAAFWFTDFVCDETSFSQPDGAHRELYAGDDALGLMFDLRTPLIIQIISQTFSGDILRID